MSVIKTILVVLYFLIGFIFYGSAIKLMTDHQSKWKKTTLLFVALLYIPFWPILFAVGLGMSLVDNK